VISLGLAALTVLVGWTLILWWLRRGLRYPQTYEGRRRARNSSHWRQLRADAYRRAGGCCERCGVRGVARFHGRASVLDLHHLTYARLGHERLSDVELICHGCHQLEHGARF
jgi:5-methylcytosine-specific restriction endonuclease McrA